MFEVAIYVGMFLGFPTMWATSLLFIAGEIAPPRGKQDRYKSYTHSQPLPELS